MYIGRHEINKNSYNLEYDLEHDANIVTDTMFPLYGDFLVDVSNIWIANEDIKWYIWKHKKNKKILEIE